MQMALDIASWIMIVGGIVFSLIGGYGLIKLKDMYARLHAASLIDTLGVGLIFFGLMLQSNEAIVALKLLLVLIFIFFTSPTATHALAKAAINQGQLPDVDTDEEREMVRAAKITEDRA